MKKLQLDAENRKLAGVCSGFAKYFEIDATIIRLLWIISIFIYGAGILLYIISMIIIPKEEQEKSKQKNKQLYRPTENRKLAGVCSGFAEYLDMDPSMVRLCWVILTLIFGFGILLYIAAIVIIPKQADNQ